MPSILLAVVHAQLDHHNHIQRTRIELETSTTAITTGKLAKGATAGGDERRLRGIPAIGRGVQGAINGTRP
ncbi:MAG TPA: hypothetical protein VFY10_11640 [Dehalococcoidia bacterium]|nr:hypothetical protein [Dehalococcoidia bacterium]